MAQASSLVPLSYQLKVRSKNPTDFEYWFCQRLMDKIRKVLLNSTSVDAGAILLYLHLSVGTRFPSCTSFHQKTLQKLTALYLLSLAHVRKCAPAYIFMTKKMRSFPQTFFISKNTWKNDRTLINKSTLFHHNKFRCGLSFDEFANRIQLNPRVFGDSKNCFF